MKEMKKLRFILLLLIIASCSDSDFQKNDLKALELNGKVKSFLQKNYSHLYEKNDYKEFEYHFDKKGFIKKRLNFQIQLIHFLIMEILIKLKNLHYFPYITTN